MKKTIFGADISEVHRQCEANVIQKDSNTPLRKFDTLEPCIAGGEMILANQKSLMFFRKLYTGRD